jgi:phenylalanyl-tRNA synthetase beta chain
MLVERFGLPLRWEQDKPDVLREGSRFTLGDLPGWIGELSASLLRKFEIKQPVYALEWTLPPHLTPMRTFRNIPTFPEARRDVSLLVEKRRRYAELRDLLWRERTEHLTHIQLVDVYEGDPLPPDRRSLTFALTYLAPDRTLTDEEVDREFWTLIERLRAKGLTIRGV